jgi:hypothetical protein
MPSEPSDLFDRSKLLGTDLEKLFFDQVENVSHTRRSEWIFICSEYEHFLRWCGYENDPPLNPNDRRWVVVVTGKMSNRVKGHYLDPAEGDRLIKHFMWQDGRYAPEYRYAISPIESKFVERGGTVEYVST